MKPTREFVFFLQRTQKKQQEQLEKKLPLPQLPLSVIVWILCQSFSVALANYASPYFSPWYAHYLKE